MVRFNFRIAVISAFIMAFSFGFVAQGQQAQTIKPKMPITEIAFAAQMLETIEIRGGEVDAFVDVKKVFIGALDAAQKEKKKAEDVIAIELSIGQAQNLLALLQRAKLTGADAERYKKFVDTVVASAQPDNKK
ncbi:MAG: hypothetical protein U0264_14975 [Candidatus Kapaibacterium sp.]